MNTHGCSILLFLMLFIGLSSTGLAQASASAPSDSVLTKATLKDNTIFWQQNRLVKHVNGKLYPVQEPIKFSNGTVIQTNGTIRLANGKTQVLLKKQAINPQGRIVLVADDIFTHSAIVEHEREAVGDTETRIVVINGQVASVKSEDGHTEYGLVQEKKIKQLEQLAALLEQRNNLLEKALTPAERKSIEAYYNSLTQQLTTLENQLKNTQPSVK